ncbi:hypothetical protein PCANC_15371 [Puccinia coronata f. sp. avenae]|uniref:Uncharacterized protein n=1 Tax=Puccinia coronata f. sp. avenae TaxID=200324 RepID=A0A2N5UFD9_9BASI|nr:hypothetical protein PCANC_15371 [Puccinia coronata f. sp. avenae]PLW36453.1 hypothetical protein PCASD_11210 [Puccinia coronata f. sp. avenae]
MGFRTLARHVCNPSLNVPRTPTTSSYNFAKGCKTLLQKEQHNVWSTSPSSIPKQGTRHHRAGVGMRGTGGTRAALLSRTPPPECQKNKRAGLHAFPYGCGTPARLCLHVKQAPDTFKWRVDACPAGSWLDGQYALAIKQRGRPPAHISLSNWRGT